MTKLFRSSVSLEKGLLDKFDWLINKNYVNRSEAFRDLIQQELAKKRWRRNKEVAGTITLVYNPCKRELLKKHAGIVRRFQGIVISAQRFFFNFDNCLEIVAVKGSSSEVQELSDTLGSIKGVKHVTLSASSLAEI